MLYRNYTEGGKKNGLPTASTKLHTFKLNRVTHFISNFTYFTHFNWISGLICMSIYVPCE